MLEGLLAPLRVVLHRSFADWLIVVATWLVIVCATTLLAIGVLYGDAVAISGLRKVLAEEPAATTSVVVDMRLDPDEIDAVDDVVSRQSRRILGWTDGELARTIRTGTYDLEGAVEGAGESDLTVFESADALDRHATLVGGGWPVAGAEPVEAALSRAAATDLGLGVGDTLSLTSRAGEERTIDVRVVGLWEPNDPAETYWLGDALELNGVEAGASFTVHGPFGVAPEDLAGRLATGNVDMRWRTLPEFGNLALDDVRWMRSDASALDDRIRAELGDATFFSVTTGLPEVLATVDRSLLVSRSGVLLLTIQFAILAAYALVLVAGLLVEQRRIETALLRSRGASAGHVAWMAFLEGLLLVVPAALAAPWIALATLRLFDIVGPLAAQGILIAPRVDAAAITVAAVAAAVCLIGLVVPAFASGRGLAAVRQTIARQGSQTLAQRLGIDLALVILAAVGLWQLRQYGAPITSTVRGTVGLDPLLVAAPAIGLLAGAILALRIVPLLAAIGERLLGGRRGLVAPLGARQLARRPLRYTRSALLLMLAAALGTFAATYTATWTRSQADQATYQAGGDVRIEVSSFPDLPLWALGGSYDGVDGVERSMPVVRDAFDVAGETGAGTLLALGTDALSGVVDGRPDLLGSRPLDELAGLLEPDLEGLGPIPLPGEPVALSIGLDSSLEELPGVEGQLAPSAEAGLVPPSLLIGRLSVAVRDARGLVHVFDQGGIRAAVAGQRIEIPLTEDLPNADVVTPDHPLELLGIQVLLELPSDTQVIGDIEVTGASVVDGAGTSVPLEFAPTSQGWAWFLEQGLGVSEPAPAAEGHPERVSFPEEAPIFGGDEGVRVLRLLPRSLAAIGDRPLPLVVSRGFADATGGGVGDELALGSLTRRTEAEIVGIVDAFPTVDPGEPFALVDLRGYAVATFARSGEDLFTDEWWLSVSDPAAVQETLAGDPYSVEIMTARADRLRELSDDPVALGVTGALAIGSVAALVLAVIGFVVSAVVSTRERLGEFALLRALGLSAGQLSAWLTLENAFLLVAGLLAGTGLGLLLAWLVLPFVTLTPEARVVVPPILVEIPWSTIGLVLGVAAVGLAVAVLIIGGVLRRVPVSGVLRSGND